MAVKHEMFQGDLIKPGPSSVCSGDLVSIPMFHFCNTGCYSGRKKCNKINSLGDEKVKHVTNVASADNIGSSIAFG